MGRPDDISVEVDNLKKQLKGKLDDAEAMAHLADILMYLRMFDEADYLYRKAVALKDDFYAAEYGIASCLYNRGNAEEAEKRFVGIAEKHPDFSPALRILATIYSESDRPGEAAAVLEKAVAAEPDDPDLHYDLGNMYDDLDESDSALAEYGKAVALDPDHAPAHNGMAIIYIDAEDWENAISAAKKALNVDPAYSNAHLNLAVAYLNHPDFPVQDAVDEFNLAIQFDPENDDAMLGLGEVYYEDTEYRRAAELFERAASANPESAQALFSLGNAYFMTGDWVEALNAYRQAAGVDEEFPAPHYWIAQALLKQEQRLEAAIQLKVYLERDPEGEWAEEASEKLEGLKTDWPV